MKIITQKRAESFAKFLVAAGIGASWLTFWWYKMTLGDDSVGSGGAFSNASILFYYILNSILLILSGVLLHTKRYKAHSIVAILLGISVTVSLFIFADGIQGIMGNLFVSTTYMGMMAGIIYGGIILVPMFHAGVYVAAFRGFRHVRGALNYGLSETIPNDFENTSSIHVPIPSEGKGMMHILIPIVGVAYALFQGMTSWRLLFSIGVNGAAALFGLIPFILVVLGVVSLTSKNVKVYRPLNIVLGLFILYPIFASVILPLFMNI